MDLNLSLSTAASSLGRSGDRALIRLPSGPWAGRLIACFLSSPTELVVRWSDPPYRDWTEPIVIANDVSDDAFGVLRLDNNDLVVAYSQTTTGALCTRRLPLVDGAWTVNPVVIVYDQLTNINPSLASTPDGRIWIAWTRLVVPQQEIRLKSTLDPDVEWGSGSTDAGFSPGIADSFVSSRLIRTTTNTYLVTAAQDTQISVQSVPHGSTTWSDGATIATGTGFSTELAVARSATNRLSVVWGRSGIWWREFDGDSWSTAEEIGPASASRPLVTYVDSSPVVIWQETWQGEQRWLRYRVKLGAEWSEPAPLDPRSQQLASVILFHQASGQAVDRTVEAADPASGNVSHPQSAALLSGSGDRIYLGQDLPFRIAYLLLSTPGSGGSIRTSYWDGSIWRLFTPVSGDLALSDVETTVRFWDTNNAIPQDWQKTAVSATVRYWIRLEVNSPFSQAPIGSRLSSIGAMTSYAVGVDS